MANQLYGVALVLTLLTSCTVQHTKLPVRLSNTYCSPSIAYHYDSAYMPKPTSQVLTSIDAGLLKKYSQHDLLLANATGVLPILHELVLAQKNSTISQQEIALKRQQIFSRLLLASTEIDGFAAELDCEGEQADQLATYLDQQDNRRIRRLTILSIVIGAATTVATALIQSDQAGKVIGIGGGIASAGFGGAAAFSSNRLIELKHKRNLLSDIWNQPNQSSTYPPMIWYVLNEKRFSNAGESSIGYNLRQRWQQYDIGDVDSKQQKLFFGEGGLYTSDDLHNRANMLNQFQSTIRSISQDLQSLIQAVLKDSSNNR